MNKPVRREFKGTDKGGEYTYYEIIDYDECYDCDFFSDNESAERFECCSEKCIKEE